MQAVFYQNVRGWPEVNEVSKKHSKSLLISALRALAPDAPTDFQLQAASPADWLHLFCKATAGFAVEVSDTHLGSGLCGSVYASRDGKTAVKDTAEPVDAESMFRLLGLGLALELQVLCTNSCPHVATCLGFWMEETEGQQGERLFKLRYQLPRYQMSLPRMQRDYCEEWTLDMWLSIAWQLATGLESLHGRGILHNDLKYVNVMVNRQAPGVYEAFIIDLGAAALLPEGRQAVQGCGIKTEGFIAPERQGMQDVCSKASDVFAFAAVLAGLWPAVCASQRLLPGYPEGTSDQLVTCLVAACWAAESSRRMGLGDFRKVLQLWREGRVGEAQAVFGTGFPERCAAAGLAPDFPDLGAFDEDDEPEGEVAVAQAGVQSKSVAELEAATPAASAMDLTEASPVEHDAAVAESTAEAQSQVEVSDSSCGGSSCGGSSSSCDALCSAPSSIGPLTSMHLEPEAEGQVAGSQANAEACCAVQLAVLVPAVAAGSCLVANPDLSCITSSCNGSSCGGIRLMGSRDGNGEAGVALQAEDLQAGVQGDCLDARAADALIMAGCSSAAHADAPACTAPHGCSPAPGLLAATPDSSAPSSGSHSPGLLHVVSHVACSALRLGLKAAHLPAMAVAMPSRVLVRAARKHIFRRHMSAQKQAPSA